MSSVVRRRHHRDRARSYHLEVTGKAAVPAAAGAGVASVTDAVMTLP